MTTKRAYQQYCGLAAALDVVGERWTLLIVRELLVRPRRYGELLNALPGIGTNLLAERLKFLADKNIIHRIQVDGSKRETYELTEKGEALRPAVLELARWGLDFIGDITAEAAVRPAWALLAVEAMIDPENAVVEEQYEFHIDDEVFHIDIRDGQVRAVAGPAERPAMTVTTDAKTFVQIGGKEISALAATVTGKLVLEGEVDALLRACKLLGFEDSPFAMS